ncbi:hypothetical protein Ami103574_02660 [Aminipila butyrica]|uniref:Uncharacterized protein n=1 Tax=Aminipila butyrica TaxID=433296 RepID=A0A858BQW8_9FIRM|nr:hypothetical protein [Aminipila butyrica]QIB68281.1 hypothetical protein Ami103574_02660 [Aminipila butyrica]
MKKIISVEEVWEVAEEAINDTYKKAYGKGIQEAFTDIAESKGRDYATGCQAYRSYMDQIRDDSSLEDFAGMSKEKVYNEFKDWYESSDMFSEMTFSDLEDYNK